MHTREAEREEQEAEEHAKQETPPPDVLWRDPFTTGPDTHMTDEERHLAAAELAREHAADHQRAAEALEAEERAECGAHHGVAYCPLLSGRVAEVREVTRGVRLYPKPGVDVQAFAREMRCYLAHTHVEGFEEHPSCPLFFRHVTAEVVAGGKAIEIGSSDKSVARQVRASAEQVFGVKKSGG